MRDLNQKESEMPTPRTDRAAAFEAEALLLAQRALHGWAKLYARLQNETTAHVSRAMDYNLPPADHVRALEAIAEALSAAASPADDHATARAMPRSLTR